MTNYEKIKRMSKPELALFLNEVIIDDCKVCCGSNNSCMTNDQTMNVCQD